MVPYREEGFVMGDRRIAALVAGVSAFAVWSFIAKGLLVGGSGSRDARAGDRAGQVGRQSHADRYTYLPFID